MKLLLVLTILLTISKIHFSISALIPFLDDVRNILYEAVNVVIEGATEVVGHPANKSNVLFYLQTSKDNEPTNNSIDITNPKELAQAKNKIYLLIHGWTQSRQSVPWYKPLTEILLKKSPDAYVIQLDWDKPASDNYVFAAFATDSVGKIVGDFIYKIVKDYNATSKNIVLIGHSLGAQICGLAAKRYFELSLSKLTRIIALDPAGPLYRLRTNDEKLNKNDAEVVMVVHTNGKGFGIYQETGTIDFYPNGGKYQPGCSLDFSNLSSLVDSFFCSHRRAFDYFPVAVEFPQYFMAKKCASYLEFENNGCGNVEVSLGDLETFQTGNFYLDTGDEFPFFNAKERIARRTNSRERKTYRLKKLQGNSRKAQTVNIH